MAESDLGSFAVAPEASLAIAEDEDTEIDRPTVTRSSAYNNWSADDPVGALFKEMARYPLLTATEEVELARRVQELVALDELEQRLQQELDRVPTKAELAAALGISETQLQQLRHQCQSAKRKMISSNLRLVVSIAKRYLNRGVPFLDLIQEGALGLNRPPKSSIRRRVTSFLLMPIGGFAKELRGQLPIKGGQFACRFTLSNS